MSSSEDLRKVQVFPIGKKREVRFFEGKSQMREKGFPVGYKIEKKR